MTPGTYEEGRPAKSGTTLCVTKGFFSGRCRGEPD